MAVVLVLLVIFGFISADNMAKRQTKDIETIIQKFTMPKSSSRYIYAFKTTVN